jgi:cell fate regulator YaaT (PSP1 superfamily)
MPEIVGIKFKKAGKVYYFDPAGFELQNNDYVVVQTARGVEIGQVSITPRQILESEITSELKPIPRKAGPEDVKKAQEYAEKEAPALAECAKMINRLNLPMKLVSAEYNLDGSRLTFHFTAEERVDFRELVRELTAFFKTRIELRQIGPRDQAKIVGGLGRCGRPLCCVSFLSEFNPVSIKMAKEQDLPLDPMKISGVCRRLQCCLAYESQQYKEAKAKMPRKGQPVETPSGKGFVVGVFPLKESVMVELESHASAEFPMNQIKLLEYQRHPSPQAEDSDEAKSEAVSELDEAGNDQALRPKTGVTTPPAEAPRQDKIAPAAGLPGEVETAEVKPETLPPGNISSAPDPPQPPEEH